METKKILIISSVGVPTPPVDYGGLEYIAYLKAIELHKMGHEVSIVTSIDSDPQKYPDGMTVIPTVFSSILQIPEKESHEILTKRVKFADFDWVHDDSHLGYSKLTQKDNKDSKTFWTWTLHDQPGNMKYIPPVENPGIICPSRGTAQLYEEQICHCMCNRQSQIHQCDRLHPFHAHEQIAKVVHHGIPAKDYNLGKGGSDRFLFLGRIQWLKGVHIAIELCKQVRAPLDIIGADDHLGPDDKYLKTIKSMCDGTLIKYIGKVDNATKAEYLSRAKACIFPSLFQEPFGLMSIESQASGTPVIVSNLGGLPETVLDGVTGIVCDTAGKMSNAIHRVNIEDLEFDGNSCREWFERNFTAEIMTSRYLDIVNGSAW